MKCPSEGKIQAYIDEELSSEENDEIEMHIFLCKKCKETYNILNNLNNFSYTKVEAYKEYPIKTDAGLKPLNIKTIKYNKGVLEMIKPYKKAIIAACAALLITTCIKVQPIQAAISNAVSIFRVQNIKSVNISLDDIKKLETALQSKKTDIQIDNIGKVNYTGGNYRLATLEEAKNKLSFNSLIPQNTQGAVLEKIGIDDASKIDFTINVANVNQVLQSLGGKTLLPKNLDGKTFTLDFSDKLDLFYKTKDSNKQFNIFQCKSPEVNAPSDVNVTEILNCISDLSILPNDLQTQLKSIKDLKNTLYVPNIGNKMEEVNIDGLKVMLYSDNNNTSAVFIKNEVLFDISGSINKDETIQIIKSMR